MWMAALLLGGLSGCATLDGERMVAQITASGMPRELEKVTLPTYRIEPPDILLIEAVNNIRPPDSRLEAGDQLSIRLQNGLPLESDVDPELNPLQYQIEIQTEVQFKMLNGDYLIGSDGQVDLGPSYGTVKVAGLTVAQAKEAIEKHLRDVIGLRDPKLSVFLPDVSGKQAISGEHLVRMDGTVSLGIYGPVYVAGMTLDDARFAVERHLATFMHHPQVNLDVLAYNSKVFYVIFDGGGLGEQIVRLPCTGNETVLDAIAQVQGLSQVSSKRIWVARPAPAEFGYAQILDVHWRAITAEGVTATNYQLLPGDRIYVKADHLIATDNALAKLLSPVERVFGIILLGTGAARSIDFYDDSNFNN
jgi:protein involved in polysaccharide export with SLBB domain